MNVLRNEDNMRFGTGKLIPGEEYVEIRDARVYITTGSGTVSLSLGESDIKKLREGNPTESNGIHLTPVKSRYREVLLIELTPESDPLAIALEPFLYSLEAHLKAVDSI